MAAPETQFGSAGIQIPAFTPVETRLNPPIQLPGTGELWAQVGRTALEAGRQLQASALNPAVRAQMQYAVSQYNQGQQHIANMQKAGLADVMTQTTPEGATMMAPGAITDPTTAARVMSALGIGPKPGGAATGAAPEVNAPAPPAAPQAPAAPQKKGPPTTTEMGKPQASIGLSPSALAASTDNDFLLRRMMQERQVAGLGGSAAAQQGTPPSMTFLNPATGNIEPLQTSPAPQQPVAPTTPSPGMFGARTAAPAPAAPTGQMPQAQPGSAISQITQQPGVALANWQAQNVHPVIAPKQVLQAVKDNVTTQAQDATYLPNGGVNGEPAWAIHMRGGGQTTISASQLAASPWGRTLMASHNVSEVMEQQNQQPPQPQTNQPGNMLLQPQPGQPPAAPGAQGAPPPGMTDIYGNPLSAYTNVQSAGGPSLANLTAQTAPAAEAAQPAPRPLWETTPQADQDAANAQAAKMGKPTGPYTGDRKVPGIPGPYTYYVDDSPTSPSRGRVYTTLPGPAGHYYDQQRWYLGTTQYEPYELPDSAARQQMWDKWGSTGFLTRAEIDQKSPQEMEPWLQRAWANDHLVNTPIDQGTNLTLDAGEDLYKTVKQMMDIGQTLAKNGYPELSSTDLFNANLEGGAEALESRRPYGEQSLTQRAGTRAASVMGGAAGMDRDTAQAIRTLDQLRDHAHQLLRDHPTLFAPGKTEGLETPNVKGELINVGTPNIKPSDVLDDVFSGREWDIKAKNLANLQTNLGGRYSSIVDGQHAMLQRVQPKHDANELRISQGGDIPDPANPYQGHTMPSSEITTLADAKAKIATLNEQVRQIQARLPVTTPPSPSTSPAPMEAVDPTDKSAVDKFIQNHPNGGQFQFNGRYFKTKPKG